MVRLIPDSIYILDGAKIKFTDISGNPEHEITANSYYLGLIAGVNIWLGGTD